MQPENITKAFFLNGKTFVEQPDGSLKPATVGQTDWAKLDALSDEEIDAAAKEDGSYFSDEDLERMFAASAQAPVRLVTEVEPKTLAAIEAKGLEPQTVIRNALRDAAAD